MATTKEAETAGVEALLADEYLSDLIYQALLERGEAAKASEITLEINNPRITFTQVRRVLGDSPRFITVDRLWNLSGRFLDRGRPTERNLMEVLNAAGRPLSTAQLATELSAIYQRPTEVYLAMVHKVTTDPRRYFRTPSGEVGPASWIPLVDADEEEDILFDNDLKADQVAPYRELAARQDWKAHGAATRAVTRGAGGVPVPHRILGVLAWTRLRDAYDPRKHLIECLEDPDLVWLSGGRWITREHAEALINFLSERTDELMHEEAPEEVVAAPVTVHAPEVEVPEAEEPAAVAPPVAAREPLRITDEDFQAIEQILAERESAVDAVDLLALQYEVVPGDPTFREDVAALIEALKQDDRAMYVGAGRFREPNSLPLYVYTIPESLSYPDIQYVSLEGEIMDEEIEDEGFAGNLRQEVLNPLAQDVGDDEGVYTGEASPDAESIRLALKAHHKEIGTFPLCQIPDGFFPSDVPVVEVAIRDTDGSVHEVIVNRELRIAYNLFGLYDRMEPESGGVFHLEKTARAYEYRFAPDEEPDPDVYLPTSRYEELLGLREQAEESGDMATFDLVCEVLAHHPKGLSFVAAMTEVNVVRRVTRRKLASILSNYYCFGQKQGSNLWRFDAKKRDMGTDRTKRKYLKR